MIALGCERDGTGPEDVARARLGSPDLRASSRNREDEPDPSASASSSPATNPPRAPADGPPLRHIERVTGGASGGDRLPLIVAIHGLGDRPKNFSRLFGGFDRPARVLLPRAPAPYGQGYSWFTFNRNDIDATSKEIRSAAARIASWLRRIEAARPTTGRPIVTGFSQGGILSFTLAVHHPEIVGEAYPVSGLLTASLLPRQAPSRNAPPLVAFHGTADRIVPFSSARDGIEALKRLDYPVTLRPYDGVGHTISTAMRNDLYEALAAALQRQHRTAAQGE